MATIGLVTVLFKSDDVLEGFFKSLSLQVFKDYHLYLIDNDARSEVADAIRSLSERYPIPAFTHVKNDANVGVATGNNQGIKLSIASGARYTLLLNNDIEIEQDFLLLKMVDAAVQGEEKLIIPKILFYDTRKIWMAGGYFIRTRGIIHHVGEGEERSARSSSKYFEYAPTCFMLLDNTIFTRVGLMDQAYFVYYDDTDFIYRCHSFGYRIFYMPELEVLHKVSSSTGGGESLFSIYYSTRNRIYFIRKNFKPVRRTVALAFTLLTRIFKYVRYGDKERSNLLRAIGDGMKMKV